MKHEQGKDGGGETVPLGWDAVSGGGEVDAAAVVASAEVARPGVVLELGCLGCP